MGNNENVTGAVRGAATAALTVAAIAVPAIAGGVGIAAAASTPTGKPSATPRPATAPPPQPVSATPCGPSAKACVVLSQHVAWLTDGNGHVTHGPVTAIGGTAEDPTPTGVFHVLSKDAHFRSTEFHNTPMPYSVFFYPGDAFHADNVHQWSHGCIHLDWGDAEVFFNTLKVGDQVQILR